MFRHVFPLFILEEQMSSRYQKHVALSQPVTSNPISKSPYFQHFSFRNTKSYFKLIFTFNCNMLLYFYWFFYKDKSKKEYFHQRNSSNACL